MAAAAQLAAEVSDQAEQLARTYPLMGIEVLLPIGEDPRMFLLMQEIIRDRAAQVGLAFAVLPPASEDLEVASGWGFAQWGLDLSRP